MDPETDREAAERVGTVLNDKWTLERLVGVGGMAAVYAGRHRNGARAAVKVLHPELARHREVRERFQREGYAANKVDHPGVVKVLDDDVVSSGPDAGTAYLVMELLEGESLQDRLERGLAFGEREFLDLASEVLEVLQAAHARGVVHRDLKPENLFFARDEAEPGKTRVKVLDFGLARLLDSQTITTYGLALGTPSFMSPEQAAGRIDEIDGRTDLFALAATGFRLRTGRRIHEAGSPVELVAMMSRLPAPRIGTYRAGRERTVRARHRPRARVQARRPLRERRRDARGRPACARGAGASRDGRAAAAASARRAVAPSHRGCRSCKARRSVQGGASRRHHRDQRERPRTAAGLRDGRVHSHPEEALDSAVAGAAPRWRRGLRSVARRRAADLGAPYVRLVARVACGTGRIERGRRRSERGPDAGAHGTGDAGAATAPGGSTTRTTAMPSGSATHHTTPKPGPSSAPKPPRTPGDR